ncbi:WD40-repeat-containing domain protein [Chytridium lagenaria]|nr:WD40-repeat-containing domain protein [Chytridium lagenaria]
MRSDDVHSNLALRSLIQDLQVYCSNRAAGCKVVIAREGAALHKLECAYNPTICPHGPLGCAFQGSGVELVQHLLDCVFEKMKDFISLTQTRIEELQGQVKTQQTEITELKKRIASGAAILDPSVIDVEPPDLDSQSDVDTWPYGEMECKRTILEHKTGVTSLAYHDSTLVSGAYNGVIKIFNSDSGRLLRNINAHDLSVWALAIHPESNRFFSTGSDCTIKAWTFDGEDQTSLNTLSHGGKVYSLAINSNRMFSASSDRTIKIWDINDLSCITTLSSHTDGINSIKLLNDTTLISASSDRTIKIWDIPTSTLLQTILDCTSEVLDITLSTSLLFASQYDASIAVYDLAQFSRVHTLRGHNWEVWKVHHADGVVFSGSHDHTIKRWDVRTFTDTATLKGHKGFVHALTTGQNCLISGCADRTVKIWR